MKLLNFFFREIAYLAVLNFFTVQKLIIGNFWNGKKWNLVRKSSWNWFISFHEFFFFVWTFLNFTAHHCVFFKFLFQNLEYEYIREDLGYGTIDLLCDVGGTLSLLMGASLLTCCELLEVAWIMLVKKCFRKVSKGISNTRRRHGGNKKNSRKSRQQTSSSNITDPDVPPPPSHSKSKNRLLFPEVA